MKKIFNYSLLIIVLVILVDQLTKGALLNMLVGGVPAFGDACDLIPQFCLNGNVIHGADLMGLPHTSWFKFVFVWNPGTSFSLFRALGESAPLVIIVLSAAVTGGLAYYLFARAKTTGEKLPLALIVGGAIANIIDRVRFGAVIDFLDFHVNTWHWPAFNFADICICVGVGLLVINWLFFNKKGK